MSRRMLAWGTPFYLRVLSQARLWRPLHRTRCMHMQGCRVRLGCTTCVYSRVVVHRRRKGHNRSVRKTLLQCERSR